MHVESRVLLTALFFRFIFLLLGVGVLSEYPASAERPGSSEWTAAILDEGSAGLLPACSGGLFQHDQNLAAVECAEVKCPEPPAEEEAGVPLLCPVGAPNPEPGCQTIRISCAEMPEEIGMCCDGEGGIEMRPADCKRLGLVTGLYCAGCIEQVGKDRTLPKPADDLEEVLAVIISRCTLLHEWGHINDQLVRPDIDTWESEQLSFQKGAECFRDFYEMHCRKSDLTEAWKDLCLSLEAHSCDSTLAESVNSCIGLHVRPGSAHIPECLKCGSEKFCSARRCLGESNEEAVREICQGYAAFYCLQEWRQRLWSKVTIPEGFSGECLGTFLKDQEACLGNPERDSCRDDCRKALEACRSCSPVNPAERKRVREYIEDVCDPFRPLSP